MRFSIRLHGPFRVGRGVAGSGADDTVDRANPLAASSLKGVMRRSARVILGGDPSVSEVFGSEGDGSPWSWSDAALVDPLIVRRRARVAIDHATGTADPGALAFFEEVWANDATFTVELRDPLSPERLERHETVLLASAHAVHSLGAQRRRGSGWVTVTAVAPSLDRSVLERLHALRKGSGS